MADGRIADGGSPWFVTPTVMNSSIEPLDPRTPSAPYVAFVSSTASSTMRRSTMGRSSSVASANPTG